MARPMQVNIRVQGVGAAVGGMRQLAAQMRQLAQLQQNLGGGTINVYNIRGGARGGGGGGSRSTFLSRLAGMVGSTRLNMGPVSPLAGRIGGLVGGGAGGPVTLALAGVAAAAGTLTTAMKGAAAAANAYSSAATVSGAKPGSLPSLAQFGVDPQSAAGRANEFRQRLTSDPSAQLARAKLGLPYLPPAPYGPTDNAKILADTLAQVQKIRNPDQQLRFARQLGVEDLLEGMRVSPEVRKRQLADASRRERMMDPKALQQLRDLNAEFRAMGELAEDLKFAFGKELGSGALMWVRGVNQMLRDATKTTSDLGKRIQGMFEGIEKMAVQFEAVKQGKDPLQFWEDYKKMRENMDSATGRAAAGLTKGIDRLNRSVVDLTFVMQKGLSGGGPRARGALPSQFVPLLQGASAGGPDALYRALTLPMGPWSL